ncbi:glycosyltransferase family 9 protein [soil metagenome]
MHILALQLKRIGDAILTAPAIAGLKAAHPGGRVTLVLAGAAGQLGPAFTGADEVLVYRRNHPNPLLWGAVVLGRFDSCYDFTGTDRSALLARLSGAPQRVGYAKFCEDGRWRPMAFTSLCMASVRDLHTVDFHRALAGCAAEETGFEASADLSQFGLPETYAVVHPGTARTEKYWFADRWAAAIRHLQDARGLPVLVTGSLDAEEQAHLASIRRAGARPFRDLSGQLDLLQLAALIARARLVASVDSAAAHLAAMAEVPQVVLFGPTNPFHWRPRHGRALVLQADLDNPLVQICAPHAAGGSMGALSTEALIRGMDAVLARR